MASVSSSSRSTSNSSSSSSSSTITNMVHQSCALLGPFSILIQAFMGLVILLSLLFRRHREKPKRNLKIWTADVSKQIIGQAFVHFLNIFISDSLASLPSQGNPCALYFINILIDTTVGVFILYLALRSITFLTSYIFNRPASSLGLSTGTYPYPFMVSWSKQLAVYLGSLIILKVAVVWMFWMGGDRLVKFGDRIINSVSSDGNVQVLMVVMIGPTCLNVMQFLLVDSFIKHRPNNLGGRMNESPEMMMRRLNDEDEDPQQKLKHLPKSPSSSNYHRLETRNSTKAIMTKTTIFSVKENSNDDDDDDDENEDDEEVEVDGIGRETINEEAQKLIKSKNRS